MITITRKIQINFNTDDKQLRKDLYDKLNKWQEIVRRSANIISTHLFIQDNIKDFFYLIDDVKIKLGNVEKDDQGIFNTSRCNTVYRLLSQKYKGEAPMNMISGLCAQLLKDHSKRSFRVLTGQESIQSYRNTIPMPAPTQRMLHWKKQSDGNYTFTLFGIDWITHFGRDLSNNQDVFDFAMKGEYKLCDSSIMINKGKIFLLAVIKHDSINHNLKPEKEIIARLGKDIPVQFTINNNIYTIGSKEEFEYRLNRIRQSRESVKNAIKFNKSGKGRKRKYAPMINYTKKAEDYVDSRLQKYTAQLVYWCIRSKSGKLIFNDDEKEPLIGRAYKFKELLQYKCAKNEIELIINGIEEQAEKQDVSSKRTIRKTTIKKRGVQRKAVVAIS